jgi:hypothetical protein
MPAALVFLAAACFATAVFFGYEIAKLVVGVISNEGPKPGRPVSLFLA